MTALKATLFVIACALAISLSASPSSIVKFAGPEAATIPTGINRAGYVTGYDIGHDGVAHGFVRSGNGNDFENIFVPGAGNSSGQGSFSYSINVLALIAGYYIDANNLDHGFTFNNGIYSTFDVPGAAGTLAMNINNPDETAGYYFDASNVYHGFVRTANGAITTFDVPGAGTVNGTGTFTGQTDCLNQSGTVAGDYIDDNGVFHAYLRTADGAITTFDAAGAGTGSGQGTKVSGINDGGVIAGEIIDSNGAFHGFVRATDGTITEFDVHDAGSGSGQGTEPTGINTSGVIVGQSVDTNGVSHGFERLPGGGIQSGNVPGAGTGAGQGTIATGVSFTGQIVGEYINAKGIPEGFIFTP